MFFTSISCAILAVVAAALSVTAGGTAAELWSIVMIGFLALGAGSLVGLWAGEDDFHATWATFVKGLASFVVLAFAAPVVLVAAGLFVLALFPSLVVILPLIAGWDFGMLQPHVPSEPPPTLIPRHA